MSSAEDRREGETLSGEASVSGQAAEDVRSGGSEDAGSSSGVVDCEIAEIGNFETTFPVEGRTVVVGNSRMTFSGLDRIRNNTFIPTPLLIAITSPPCTACNPPRGFTAYSVSHIYSGARLPLPPFIKRVLNQLRLAPLQLTPNSFSNLIGLYLCCKANDFPAPSLNLIQYYMILRRCRGEEHLFYLSCRDKTRSKEITGFKRSHPTDHKEAFFFVDDVADLDHPAFNLVDVNRWSSRPGLNAFETSIVNFFINTPDETLSVQNRRSTRNLIAARLIPNREGISNPILAELVEEEILNVDPINQAPPTQQISSSPDPDTPTSGSPMPRQNRITLPGKKRAESNVATFEPPERRRPEVPRRPEVQETDEPLIRRPPTRKDKGKEPVSGKRPSSPMERAEGGKRAKEGSKLLPEFDTLLDTMCEGAGEAISEHRQKVLCQLKGGALRKEALGAMLTVSV